GLAAEFHGLLHDLAASDRSHERGTEPLIVVAVGEDLCASVHEGKTQSCRRKQHARAAFHRRAATMIRLAADPAKATLHPGSAAEALVRADRHPVVGAGLG